MLEIPTFDDQGKPSGSVELDPVLLGGRVRPQLLKQAIVMYQANARQNTSATKSRGFVSGSTRKLYRQKGTGNARAGARRTGVRKGGGVAFAKGKQNFDQDMNKKMRRLARNNAILAKAVSNNVVVVDDMRFDSPSTRRFSAVLRAVGADNGCLVALGRNDETTYRSGRNITKTEIRPMAEVNAYEIMRSKRLVLMRSAFDLLVADPTRLQAAESPA
jgi:large subunit ribosomal protein L4